MNDLVPVPRYTVSLRDRPGRAGWLRLADLAARLDERGVPAPQDRRAFPVDTPEHLTMACITLSRLLLTWQEP